jgi:hypothetical protein
MIEQVLATTIRSRPNRLLVIQYCPSKTKFSCKIRLLATENIVMSHENLATAQREILAQLELRHPLQQGGVLLRIERLGR